MPGTRTNAFPVHGVIVGYSLAATTAAQNLTEHRILFPCLIRAVKASAETAGTGAGNEVLDVLKNGTSIWTTAGNRPTLLGTSTGEFANTAPDTKAFQVGDLITLQVATIPATTGQARVSLAVALELV